MRKLAPLLSTALVFACTGDPQVVGSNGSAQPLLAIGATADAIFGQQNARADREAQTTGAGLSSPRHLAVASTGTEEVSLWVVDRDNERVLGWRSSGESALSNFAPAAVVLGQPDPYSTAFEGVSPPPGLTGNFSPITVAADSEGRVYLADASDVAVYEDPFTTDRIADYVLESPPGSIDRLSTLANGFLGVVSSNVVYFYNQGDPRLFTETAVGAPAGCTISDVASTPTVFMLACESSVACNAAVPPADCTGPTGATEDCFAPNCGSVYAYSYDLATNLPDPSTAALVYFGFQDIQGIELRTSSLFVTEGNGHRAVRIEDAANDALATLSNSTLNPARSIYSAAVDLDVAWAQGNDVKSFVRRFDASAPGQIGPAGISSGLDIAVDDTNNDVWLVDAGNNRVVRYTNGLATAPNVTPQLVLGQPNFTVGFPNAIEESGFGQVEWIGVDWRNGRLYAADSGANRIVAFDSPGALSTGADGSLFIGQSDGLRYFPNGSQGASINENAFNNPTHLFVDKVSGDLYVTDSSNRRIIGFTGVDSDTSFSGDLFFGASDGLSVGGFNFNAVASENGRLYASVGARVELFLGSDRLNPERTFGSASSGANGMSFASGLTVSEDGMTLYVADANLNRILRFDEPAGADEFPAITADGVIGQRTFFETSSGLGVGKLSGPQGIELDARGRLWVADTDNNRVLMFPTPESPNPATGLVEASYVLGQSDFDERAVRADDGVNGGTLSQPSAVATNREGTVVYVVDSGNNRVLRFTEADRLVLAGGGTFSVAPGASATVDLAPSDSGATLEIVAADAQISLSGTELSVDASELRSGARARATVSASVAGPPAQVASTSVVFLVEPGSNGQAANPPPSRAPIEIDDSCACAGFASPWFSGLAVLALLRRRRRDRR